MLAHTRKRLAMLPALLLFMALGFVSCSVYTVDKLHLENKLKPDSRTLCASGLGLNKLIELYKKQYNNQVDTLLYLDKIGKVKAKRLNYDSKITVITTGNKSIRFYAKSLYIWKDEFLIGERTVPSLHGPSYFPVKLKDIARIEVRI